MNILFVTSELFPYLNAASEIVYRLSEEMSKTFCCNISVIGYNQSCDISYPEPNFPIKTYRIRSITDYYRVYKLYSGSKITRRLKYIIYPHALIYAFRRKFFDFQSNSYFYVKDYQTEITRLLHKDQIDCIVGFMMPQCILTAISDLHLKIPFIAYKLDPWSTNCIYVDNKEEYQKEASVDKNAARIVVTDLIEKEYKVYASEEILKKLVAFNFPNVIAYEKKERLTELNDGKIHCVFAGSFYKNIRNPEYAVKLFEKLTELQIVFDIVGFYYGDPCLPNPLPPNVRFHGKVSSDEAMQYMQSADILVNIGNTVLNQMPSKILTYISLGKPILNIIKSPECPTLPYMVLVIR